MKRIRTRDFSKKGVEISADALALNCETLPQLFGWYDGKPKETYRAWINPDDRYVIFVALNRWSIRHFLRMWVCVRQVYIAAGSASRTGTT